jgi:hypothetical protein
VILIDHYYSLLYFHTSLSVAGEVGGLSGLKSTVSYYLDSDTLIISQKYPYKLQVSEFFTQLSLRRRRLVELAMKQQLRDY